MDLGSPGRSAHPPHGTPTEHEMTSTRIAIAACAVFAVAACQQSKADAASPAAALTPAGPGPAATPMGAPAGKEGRYGVVVAPVSLRSGATASVTMRIEPAKGLKFNKDFPSKFTVNPGRHAKCAKADLTKKGGDVVMDGEVGVVTIPLVGTAAGAGDLSVIGNFSVCNEEQCFVLRGESLSVSVTVK